MAAPFDYLFKILLVGDPGVGKSSLLHRLCDGAFSFSDTYVATWGLDFKIHRVEQGGKRIKLQIWDAPRPGRFGSPQHSLSLRGASCVCVVYDVTDRDSFDCVAHDLRTIAQHAAIGVPVVLVANKSDYTDELAGAAPPAGAGPHVALSISYMSGGAPTDVTVGVSATVRELKRAIRRVGRAV
jgi:small GTP-binding protein